MYSGGEGGIRTHGTVTRTPHFECGAFDLSATSPQKCYDWVRTPDQADEAARLAEMAGLAKPLNRLCPHHSVEENACLACYAGAQFLCSLT